MRRFTVLFSALLLASVIQAHAQPPAKDTAAQSDSLLKQRRDALDSLVQILVDQYRAGTVDFSRLSDALHRLGGAGLELAKSKDERTAACQKQVALCRDVTKICQARVYAGRASQIDVCDAIAEQTMAEIRLLREKSGDNPAQVESLMKERRLALAKAVEIRGRQYGGGTLGFSGMAVGESQLADVELELAKNKDERIAVCQKQVELCRDVEKICQAKYEAGQVSNADLFEARAERLKAEIRLLREKVSTNRRPSPGP